MMEIITCDIKELELKTQNNDTLSMKGTLSFCSFAESALFLYSLYVVTSLEIFLLK